MSHIKVKQREIVEVTISDEIEKHPFLVLSNNCVNSIENFFVGVMLSTKHGGDDYAFPIDNSMLERGSVDEGTNARSHIINMYMKVEIHKPERKRAIIKKSEFKNLLAKIHEAAFSLESNEGCPD